MTHEPGLPKTATPSASPSRRRLVQGAAWTVPVVAVAAAAPAYAKSGLPDCLQDITTSGGTYPVNLSSYQFPACGTQSASYRNTHWDFRFVFTTAQEGNNCPHKRMKIRVYDIPGWSSWIVTNSTWFGRQGPGGTRLYIEKIVSVGSPVTFPVQGDTVRREDNNNSVGTITAWQGTDDSLHVRYKPTGWANYPGNSNMTSNVGGCTGLSSNTTFAKYDVWYSDTTNGNDWALDTAGPYNLQQCVPMIMATASVSGNTRKVKVETSTVCSGNNIVVTKIVRNNSDSSPSGGTAVWTGSQAVTGQDLTISNTGSGSYLWVFFKPTASAPATDESAIWINRPA